MAPVDQGMLTKAELRVPAVTDPLAFRLTAFRAPAEQLPDASRLTMAFATSALVGATVQLSPSVPLPVSGEPLTVKSVEGAPRPTLVTVPVPGKVWLEMNVTLPV